tara:strand:+ start:4992 stop:5594 length:603 start_codon:yes stop_codon:yes gene_type:complete
MELYLAIDTETTGFKRSGQLTQTGQARMCQLGMILFDETGKELSSFKTLIKPDDWVIGEGAFRCHGISQEDCEMYGIPQEVAMRLYYALASKAKMKVAHNAKFDQSIMEIEDAYFDGQRSIEDAISINKHWYCTQENSKDICRIPPTEKMVAAGRYHHKTPSLEEALFHFTGEKLDGAHDAMVDTIACKKVLLGIMKCNS